MTQFNTIDDVLEFAIKDEQRASDLYAGLATRSRNKEIRQMFEQFSREELGHRKKLEAIKSGSVVAVSKKGLQDLKIGDYLVEVNTSRDDLSYQEALIVAMKEEKAAFRLYSDLAARTDDSDLKETFLKLAQEEAKHKLRFEIEYDDYILTDN
ncbi:MAG: ferritin family protein [Acidobacteria bacterium]|nr:ferritin family protein [Acidobacteriota bacterium]